MGCVETLRPRAWPWTLSSSPTCYHLAQQHRFGRLQGSIAHHIDIRSLGRYHKSTQLRANPFFLVVVTYFFQGVAPPPSPPRANHWSKSQRFWGVAVPVIRRTKVNSTDVEKSDNISSNDEHGSRLRSATSSSSCTHSSDSDRQDHMQDHMQSPSPAFPPDRHRSARHSIIILACLGILFFTLRFMKANGISQLGNNAKAITGVEEETRDGPIEAELSSHERAVAPQDIGVTAWQLCYARLRGRWF